MRKHLIKLLIIVLAMMLLHTTLSAQKPLENSLLWRISGKKLTQPSYLYGTIHLICVQDFILRGQTIEAMNKCQRIAFEMDFFNKQDMTNALQQYMLTDTDSYKRWLEEKDYQRLRHFMTTTLFIPDSIWTKTRPPLLVRRMIGKMLDCMKTGAEDVVIGVSRRDNETRGYNHEFTGLETTEDRTKLGVTAPKFDSLLTQSIVAMIPYWKKIQADLRRAAQEYKAENIIGTMQSLASEPLLASQPSSKEYTKTLLDARNKLWLPRIEKMMTAKPTFFAVGAGHLVGDNGVIMLLRKQGYTVEPITKREQVIGRTQGK